MVYSLVSVKQSFANISFLLLQNGCCAMILCRTGRKIREYQKDSYILRVTFKFQNGAAMVNAVFAYVLWFSSFFCNWNT